MESTYKFEATAYWVMGSRGIVSGEAVPQAIEFSAPPEFDGEEEMWTPEHFFLGSVATCFISTFRSIAQYNKFEMIALDVTVEGVLNKEQGGYRFADVFIRPVLTVASEEDREKGLKLLEKSERACLVSRSLNSKITMEPRLQVSKAVGAQ
jgi:peroxiredoxin-like protein